MSNVIKINGYDVRDPNAVHYNAADGATDAQKAQARTNIGGASAAEVAALNGAINATDLYQIVYPDIVRDKGVATVLPSYVNRSVTTATGEIGGVAANRITNDALIYIPDGAAFGVTINDTTNYYLPTRFCFDKNKAFLERVTSADGGVAEGTVYVRLLLTRKDNGNLTPEDAQSVVTVTLTKQTAHEEIQALETALPTMIETAMFETGINKFDPDATSVGFINNANTGAIQYSTDYFTSDFIDVSEFTKGYAFSPNARKILFYDASKTPISASYRNDETAAGVIALDASYKYFRMSC